MAGKATSSIRSGPGPPDDDPEIEASLKNYPPPGVLRQAQHHLHQTKAAIYHCPVAKLSRCKNVCALLLLFGISVFAADFWQSKPFADWSPKDVEKMLQNSPWSKRFIAGLPGRAILPQNGRTTGGQGMPDGGNGVPGGNAPDPGAIPIHSDGSSGRLGGASRDNSSVPGQFIGQAVILVIRWQSSMPVREAILKTKYGSEAGTSPEAKKALDARLSHYIIAVDGTPRAMLGPANAGVKKRMMEEGALIIEGTESIKPDDVSFQEYGPNTEALFAFPKTTPITADDKEVEFKAKIGGLDMHQKFRLKDMVVNGKLEL